MYQQQSFHTSSYRGNQPGHDNQWRSDSQNPSGIGFGSSGSVQSQYRGMNKSFQPTGTVQSVYGQTQSGFGGTSQFASQQSFHNANYRGHQQGHDNYLRADATSPSSGFGAGISSYGSWNQSQQSQQSQYQPQSTQSAQSFHSANYRGNQQGHDNYLRADATSPSSGYGTGASAPSYSSVNQGQNQFQSQYQPISSSYQTANYRGNQPGHDSYLRADATSPSSFGQAGAFGASGFAGTNAFGSTGYGRSL